MEKAIYINSAEKGKEYFFCPTGGEVSSLVPKKFRKREVDVEIDGEINIWNRESTVPLFETWSSAEEYEEERKKQRKEWAKKNFKNSLEEEIKTAQENIQKFSKDLGESKNPVYNMEWSRDIFEAAAKFELYSRVLKLLDEGKVIPQILEYYKSDLIGNAKYVTGRSTCPTHNLMADYKIAVTAYFCDRWNYYAEILKEE